MKKNRKTAWWLAILVWGLWAHKFYLWNYVAWVLYIMFCFTLIPGIISFIEAILFFSMSDKAFEEKYYDDYIYVKKSDISYQKKDE